MRKLRLALRKGEELRFLSHLDYAQAVTRILRRARIEVAYSEGFNPHMKMSFSSALAVGITADAEYMDIEIEDSRPLETIMEAMNHVAPAGLEVVDGIEVYEKLPKMMAICDYALYSLTGSITAEADWDALLTEFNDVETIMYEKVTPKRTKMIDVKPLLRAPIRATIDDQTITLHMAIGIYPEGTVKPSEVWQIGIDQFHWPLGNDYAIHRIAIGTETAEGFIDPLHFASEGKKG